MKIRKYRHFVGDFETTVYKGQQFTEVWASACVELFNDNVNIFTSIEDTLNHLFSLNSHIIIYYHNLKFDGSFWLPYLIQQRGFKQAYDVLSEDGKTVKFHKEKHMENNTFKYAISDMGAWYNIIIKHKNKYIEIRDSYKLLPFSVRRMGESFKTKHRKLDMEYKGFRYSGCEITPQERVYIENDVLVVKECLEIMFNQGHDKLTIGSCCLEEYKSTVHDWDKFFPDVYEIPLDKLVYGAENVDEYVRKAYRGGWCYTVKGKEKTVFNNGCTADVNSLYPSVMHSESGNRYPVGVGKFWSGNFIPDKALKPNMVYYIRIRTRFYLKHNMLPFIQIKNNFLYKGSEMLETSDIKLPNGEYTRYIEDRNGNLTDSCVELTLTMTDYKLMQEHYELVDFEILDGVYFYSEIGIFDEYIDKYKEIKMKSDGAVRESAKLFLNNLYGKMASSKNSSFKVAYEKSDGSLGFFLVKEKEKQSGYIPVGAFITSYARDFTIRVAQQNFYGADKDGFIYADTDSIHCSLPHTEIKGAKFHPTEFCCWNLESIWDMGYFVRSKTYVEHVTGCVKNGQVIMYDSPHYEFKCAGMPDKSKQLFEKSMTGYNHGKDWKHPRHERQFIRQRRSIEEFNVGLKVSGKLLPKRIKGGIILVDTEYQMRA